jgi:hypothetical protein
MAIDTKPFIKSAKLYNAIQDRDHYDGCELNHVACAVLYLAGALDAAQKRLDKYLAEIERLQKAEKALEYVAYQYKTERDAARAINSETLSPESDTQPDLSIKGGTQGGAQ